MIYIYGLSSADPKTLVTALHERSGLQNPLEITSVSGWSLIHSAHDDQEILPKRKLLLAHTRVLEGALTAGSILPARFGLVAATMREIETLVAENAAPIAAQFKAVEGAVEIGVRVAFSTPPVLAATLRETPKLQALHKRLNQSPKAEHFAIAEFGGQLAEHVDRRRGSAQRALLAALVPLCRDHVLRAPESDTEVLRAEFLLDATDLSAFEEAVTQAADDLNFADGAPPDIQFIGPVPMYNFVRLNLHFDHDREAA